MKSQKYSYKNKEVQYNLFPDNDPVYIQQKKITCNIYHDEKK